MANYGAIDGGAVGMDIVDDTMEDPPPPASSFALRRSWCTPRMTFGAAAAIFALLVTYANPNYHYLASLRCRMMPSSSKCLDSRIQRDENEELFFEDQLVNHFDASDQSTWKHRYYVSTKHFRGKGHPIFHVVGGEGALDHGMLYPFVTEHLAPYFGAAVIQVEHRFYGEHRPIVGRDATVKELLELLTPQQAMSDNVKLGRYFAMEVLECSPHRNSSFYCPVITVGGSYPGFLSAMLRVVHPDYADASYASSAPLKLYDQSTDQNVYYDIVSMQFVCTHTTRGF